MVSTIASYYPGYSILVVIKMKTNFILRFDSLGNSIRFFSNGIISVKVKLYKNEEGKLFNYFILDMKSGMNLKNQACVSHRSMLMSIRRDIKHLFEIYSSSDEYDLVITKKLSLKNRRI